MDERWNIGEPGGPAGPFYSIVSSTGRVIVLQIPDRETAERICKLPELRARAIELETQLAPLQQQFDDWAEQNRRAEAEAHRRRDELEIAIQRLISKEQWARAWKRTAKTRRAWCDRYKDRATTAEATNARLRAALEAAAEYAWQSEVVEPQMRDLLIGEDNEYANKRDWLDSKVAEWMEAQP